MDAKTVSVPERIRVGCSGWVYRHWRGIFYPRELPHKRWFDFYASIFDTVEINASHYRLPPAKTFDNWREQAPDGFCYAVKAGRFITHMKKLKGVKEPFETFLTRVRHLGPTLGPILYQLPANLHKNLERIEYFLELLPRDIEHVFEFRDPSWYAEEIFAALDNHGAGLVVHDMEGSAAPWRACGRTAYLRFHGTAGKYHGRYGKAQLEAYAAWLIDQRQTGRSAWAFFNNDIHGHATEDARTLKALLG